MSGNRNPIYLQLFRHCPREALHFSIYPMPRACQPTQGHTAEAQRPQGEEWRGPAWSPREPSSAPKPEPHNLNQSQSVSPAKEKCKFTVPSRPCMWPRSKPSAAGAALGRVWVTGPPLRCHLVAGPLSSPAVSENPRKSTPPVPFDPTLPHRAKGTHMAVPLTLPEEAPQQGRDMVCREDSWTTRPVKKRGR